MKTTRISDDYPSKKTILGWRKGDLVTRGEYSGTFVRRGRSALSGAFVEIQRSNGSRVKLLNDWDIHAGEG